MIKIDFKEIRIKRGITQEECADLCGVSIRYLQRIESGEKIPSIEILAKIANTLEVATGSLIKDL